MPLATLSGSLESLASAWGKDWGRDRLLVIDTHTAGNPTRIVVGGLPIPAGVTGVAETRRWLRESRDDVRTRLVHEPRGGGLTCAVVPLLPTGPSHDLGAVILEPGSYPPMCGHCMIGLSIVVDELDLVPVPRVGPTARFTIDTPAGLVRSRVVRGEQAATVTLTNVESFVVDSWRQEVLGRDVRVDLVYGGDYYPTVDADELGLGLNVANARAIVSAAHDLWLGLNDREIRDPDNGESPHVYQAMFHQRIDGTAPRSRIAVVAPPGVIDRSPCGTGSSALFALRATRGEIALSDALETRSIIDSRFEVTADSSRVTPSGRLLISPSLSGTAHVNGFSIVVADPSDELGNGFPPL